MKDYPLIKTKDYTEKIIDVLDFQESWSKNESWQITFKIIQSDFNAFEFALIENEEIIVYDGEDFVIKSADIVENENSTIVGKEIIATHVMYDIQGYVQEDTQEGNKTYTITSALNFLLGGNHLGYSWVLHGAFSSITSENLGGDMDGVESISFICERFGAVCVPQNKVLHFYLESEFGEVTQSQFKEGYNVRNTKLSISTLNLKTAIRGYGKKVDVTDIFSKYTALAIERVGTGWTLQNGYWTATKINDAFKFSFSGTGLRVKMLQTKLGGKWTFKIDGTHTKQVSGYSSSGATTEKLIEVKRGLENKTHTVVCTLVSRDGDNPNTKYPKLPEGVVNTGDWIGLYRAHDGTDQVYLFDPITYISPNVNLWNGGVPIYQKPVRDDVISNPTTMRNKLISTLQDAPEISLATDLIDDEEFSKGDAWNYSSNNTKVDTEVKIVGYSKYPYDSQKNSEVVFSNARKAMSDIQQDIRRATKEAQKAFKNIGKTVIESIPAEIKDSSASFIEAKNANVEFTESGIQTSKQESANVVSFGNGVISVDDEVLIDENGINLNKVYGTLPEGSQNIILNFVKEVEG